MNFPIRRELTDFDEKYDFEGSGFCPQQWEISVCQKHGITWSIVLSYLKSADFEIPGQFERRLNQLTGDAVDSELAKAAILDFNPFFNIHKCFFNETLQTIVKSFSKRVSGGKKLKACESLKKISSMLNIKILLADLEGKKLILIEPENNSDVDAERVTLIDKEHITEENGPVKRFHFGLDENLCTELRKKALEIVLETSDLKAKAEEEIFPVLNRGEKDINFLITLLKKDLVTSVYSLYESWYVAGKVSNAGFETDPRVLDSDKFSAFYYALRSSDSNLVNILYRYAANSCYESESTFRDPNPCIVSNFSNLKAILNGDCDRSNNFENFGDRSEPSRVTYQDLLIFNEFLTQVTRGINEIRKRPHGSPLEEAAKQREIILLILDVYDNFFYVRQLDSTRELIEDYTSHKSYYDNLDFAVALLFFDNIFLLKSVLKSPEVGLYSKLESSFLLCAITNKYFIPDGKNGDNLSDLGLESNSVDLSIIPLLERRNLWERIKNFCSILRRKTPTEEDIVPCIPKEEISEMLSDFLELKDEVLIFRLDHYLKTAHKIKGLAGVPESMKEKFVIQRVLQVIGESIIVENSPASSIRHLLRKCLPEETLENLKKIRNTLSHLKSFQFPLKFKTEEDDILFASIQTEIRRIKEAFEKVFDIQRVRLLEFLINRGLASVQKFQQNEVFDMNSLIQSMKNFEDELRNRSSELKSKLDRMDTVGNGVLVPNIKDFCRILFGCARESVESKLQGEIPQEVSDRDVANQSLLKDLERGVFVDLERFNNLFLKKEDIISYKKMYEKYLSELSNAEGSRSSKLKGSLVHKVRKSANPVNTLKLIFDKKKVSDSQLKTLFEWVPFSVEAKSTLNSLIEISKNPCGDNLANLRNRIEHLYQIAVKERYDILYLWERVKSFKARQYLVYKIVQRYFREPSFQASLEMLLFDCVDILKNNEDFKCFWLKDSYLFNGIDVRNVLAHGDPLLESIGDILDPKDLPTELVKKMLQLFEDRECIEALCDLWGKAKLSDKVPDNSSDWNKLKERIVRCARWENYSKLLAEDPKDSKTCEDVVSFLTKVPVPKMNKFKKQNSCP